MLDKPVQLLIDIFPYYYRTPVMSVNDALEFIEKTGFPDFLFADSNSNENETSEERQTIYNFCKDKTFDSTNFFSLCSDLNEDELYSYFFDEELDIPYLKFFKGVSDDVVYGLEFDWKFPFFRTLDECKQNESVEIPISIFKDCLYSKIPLNETVVDLDESEINVPCLVYKQNSFKENFIEFMPLSRFSYLQHKFLTEPEHTLIKVKLLKI